MATEDNRYFILDNLGRILYRSEPFKFPFTHGEWTQNCSYFILFSFNEIILVDKTGKIIGRIKSNPIAYSFTVTPLSN